MKHFLKKSIYTLYFINTNYIVVYTYKQLNTNLIKFLPIVTCTYYKNTKSEGKFLNVFFKVSIIKNNQEIESQYITNSPLYTRVLQYLNYDIARDVYLRLPNQPDSVAAITASYPRQYGSTGRSSVLLVFPVSEKQLRHGCFITFKGEKLELGTRRFVFTAQDIKAARARQRPAH